MKSSVIESKYEVGDFVYWGKDRIGRIDVIEIHFRSDEKTRENFSPIIYYVIGDRDFTWVNEIDIKYRLEKIRNEK